MTPMICICHITRIKSSIKSHLTLTFNLKAPLSVDITYTIQNDCGLNADSVMNSSEGAPLKADMPANCPTDKNCLLVISTINTIVMPSDDADTLADTLVDGIKESFRDGSFFDSVPQKAAECPDEKRGEGWMMMKIGEGKK
eukprot:scaffold582_cov69-Cyclotella_meneghiniana.AAC.1